MRRKNYEAPFIFVDMDGVLARWIPGGDWQSDGYYLGLPAHEEVVSTVKKLLSEGFRMCILTCYPSEGALRDKLVWRGRQGLSQVRTVFVPYGERKSEYAARMLGRPLTKKDFLLDDYTENLEEFDSAGGTGLKLLNGINDTRGSWKGIRISIGDCYSELKKAIGEEGNMEKKKSFRTVGETVRELRIGDDADIVLHQYGKKGSVVCRKDKIRSELLDMLVLAIAPDFDRMQGGRLPMKITYMPPGGVCA